MEKERIDIAFRKVKEWWEGNGRKVYDTSQRNEYIVKQTGQVFSFRLDMMNKRIIFDGRPKEKHLEFGMKFVRRFCKELGWNEMTLTSGQKINREKAAKVLYGDYITMMDGSMLFPIGNVENSILFSTLKRILEVKQELEKETIMWKETFSKEPKRVFFKLETGFGELSYRIKIKGTICNVYNEHTGQKDIIQNEKESWKEWIRDKVVRQQKARKMENLFDGKVDFLQRMFANRGWGEKSDGFYQNLYKSLQIHLTKSQIEQLSFQFATGGREGIYRKMRNGSLLWLTFGNVYVVVRNESFYVYEKKEEAREKYCKYLLTDVLGSEIAYEIL